jgi:branched-chain amino acid transport system permease protein
MGLVAIPIVSILNTSLFAGRGITPVQAVLVFIAATIITYFWQPARTAANQRMSALPTKQQRMVATGAYIVLGIGVLALPLLGPYPAEILDTVGIYILMGLGLNIVVGFAGLLDLGYVAFFAIGAYTIGILTSPEIQWLGIQLTWWEACPLP